MAKMIGGINVTLESNHVMRAAAAFSSPVRLLSLCASYNVAFLGTYGPG